jgi:UDP-N-acetylglucosamine 2-epimerase (non-hydrolysing)
MSGKKVVIGCVIGTRPELIKMAPVIFKLQESDWAEVKFINTAQHRGLLDDMLSIFSLKPDIDLNIMVHNQSLGELTGNLCKKLDILVKEQNFDALLAVGDTTTVFVAALIAFYHNIPYGHIEAGLRTQDVRSPFPEEINRLLTAPLAQWHFAPTKTEQNNLLKEQISASKILITGNPVIDALYWVLEHRPVKAEWLQIPNIIVVTAHRRENFGVNLQNICQAVLELSQRFKHMNFVIPVHPNPNVQQDVLVNLADKPGVHLLPPLQYDEFAHLMNRSVLIMTDSGGIQEEAPALHKPVLVLRDNTERPEVVNAGVGLLVGTKKHKIVEAVSQLLEDSSLYKSMAKGISPYGDGHAAERIVACIYQHFRNSDQ